MSLRLTTVKVDKVYLGRQAVRRLIDDVKDRLKDEGINLEYVQFSDYNQPNAALADGSIDLNSFQHQFFLDNYNEEFGTDLVSIGNTVNAPLGIYSDKVTDVNDLAEGAKVAIPNDVTNKWITSPQVGLFNSTLYVESSKVPR